MRKLVALVPAVVLLAACSAASTPAASPATKVLAADPWVRTTDESKRPDMTAVFVNLTNPTSEKRTLVKADCGSEIAEKTELHEMVKSGDQMVMQLAKDGIEIPAGGHQHLAPGGPHIMLMGLKKELPVGSTEIKCTLTLDNDQVLEITAPVKKFTEEQDTYHTHNSASPSMSPSA